jgi:hypothetical protein
MCLALYHSNYEIKTKRKNMHWVWTLRFSRRWICRQCSSISWHHIIFFILVCEVIGTAATPGLLCEPQVIVKMIVEKQMECRLAGETEVLGGNLPQRHSCPSQNPTWPGPGLKLGRRAGKPATNRLSYGAAMTPYNLVGGYLRFVGSSCLHSHLTSRVKTEAASFSEKFIIPTSVYSTTIQKPRY